METTNIQKTMETTKKPYVKPEMEKMDIRLEPILAGSFPTDRGGWNGWYD